MGHHKREKHKHFFPPLTLTPSVTPADAKFRGPSSSELYNEFFRDAYNDLMNAYLVLQQNNNDISIDNEILVTQQGVALQQISYLQGSLTALAANYSSLISFGQAGSQGVQLVQDFHQVPVSWGGFPSYYPLSAPMSSQTRATYDPIYGQIVPSLAAPTLSKAYILDPITGNIVLPPDVIEASSKDTSPSLKHNSYEETDIQNAVDGDSTSYWRRNYYFQQAVDSVSQHVVLKMPYNYVNSLLCNYLTIHPYPEFGVDILSARINIGPDKNNSNYIELLPTDANGNPIPIQNAGKTRLLFPDTEVASFEIVLQQRTSNEVIRAGYDTYTLGASVIDFGYMTFNQGVSLVLVPFTLQSNFFNYVTAVGPLQAGVTLNLYYEDPTGDLVACDINQLLPAYVKTIWVECALGTGSGVLPVLNNLYLRFWPVYT